MDAIFADDFFSGIFAALACRGVRSIAADEKFHAAMTAAAEELLQLDPTLDVRFRIRVHPIHHDSEVVREGVSRALVAGLVTLRGTDPVTLDVAIEGDFARTLVASLPGGAALYERLAMRVSESCSVS